jgi:hypothetical protein
MAVAECPPGDAGNIGKAFRHLVGELRRIALLVGVVIGADIGGDGETGRHRQAQIGHLGEAGAFAAEQVAHVGASFGLAVAERVDPFRLGCRFLGPFGSPCFRCHDLWSCERLRVVKIARYNISA